MLFAVGSLLLCSCLGTNEPAAFTQANRLMVRGENHKALREYQGLLRKGLRRSELHCNLGNALLRDGHPGWAVVYYEKGLLLAPADSQIQKNEWVALRRGAPGPAASQRAPVDLRDQLAAWCDGAAAVAMSMLLISCGLICLAATRLFPAANPTLMAWAKGISGSFGTLFLLSTGTLLSRSYPGQAIVLSRALGRTGPSERAAKAAQFYLGEKVEIENQFQGWVKVKRGNGEEGWLTGTGVALVND